jgi:tRNA(Arg) A34 adenosine deaminase TadA
MSPSDESVFQQQVLAQIDRLKNKDLRTIEKEVIEKRTAWIDRLLAEEAPAGRGKVSPRFAFETLFFRYMGLPPHELPVLRENDDEIVWSSQNPCPTLEACRQLALDTRVVCRAAYEKSTQAFVSRIDPQFRFLRDYDAMRPVSEHCVERIVRVPFEQMMRVAIEEAVISRREGNKGYGAVAALGAQVLVRAHDTAASERDPCLHAEVNAIRQATRALGDSNLSGVVLFSTCEPCPMCSSLAVWANVSAIVFGASIEQTAAKGKARILVPAREVVSRSPVTIEIIGGVLEQECLSLY